MTSRGEPAQAPADGSQPAAPAEADVAPADGQHLRHVIRRLLTPARAGLFLSRDDLERLSAALGFVLPALDRRIMLEHLFVAAGPAGLLPRLLDLMAAEADGWIATYREWETSYPHTAAIWADWRGRAEALRADLAALRVEAERAASSPPR